MFILDLDVDVDICQLEGPSCSNRGGPKLSASTWQEDGRAHLLAGLPSFLHPIQSFAGLGWSKSNFNQTLSNYRQFICTIPHSWENGTLFGVTGQIWRCVLNYSPLSFKTMLRLIKLVIHVFE